jgi:Zn-dependent protease with chaperone function
MQSTTVDRPADATQLCPKCGAQVPVYPGYVVWCDKCGWNLQPRQLPQSRNILETWYRAAGKRAGASLFAEVVAAPSLAPRITPAIVLAYMVAVLVHSFTLALLGLGLWLIVGAWGSCLTLGLGLLCLAMVWLLRPQLPALDDSDRLGLISREQCPALYQLVDSIAQTLGSHPPDFIVLNPSFNAALGAVGRRWQKVLYVGLPLFAILDGRERVALLSHELAHSVNGDSARSFVVSTAIDSLATWYDFLRPAPTQTYHAQGMGALAALAAHLLMRGISRLVYFIAMGLLLLLWRNKQRAEYLADSLAASVSGTDAMLALLEKLHLDQRYARVVQRIAIAKWSLDLFPTLKAEVAAVPPRELERIRRIEHMTGSRLDSTHPPTAFRLDLMRAHPIPEAKVVLSTDDCARLDAELAAFHKRMQSQIMEAYYERYEY